MISLLDANVWLALAFSDHQHHRPAVDWFDQQANQSCAFCRVTQMALLRHLTNKAIMGEFLQTQNAAWLAYDCFANDPRVIFLEENSETARLFRAYTQSLSSSLRQWTDGYLAAFAVSHNAELITFDRSFKTFEGFKLRNLN